MVPRILVVDRNEAFATMLAEMLETGGGYEVKVAHAGSEALVLLRQRDFDLTIVDTGLNDEDMDYRQLLRTVREEWPAMRLMVIRLKGEDLPAEVQDLNLQGTLSKPFFADDLLPSIQEVLAKEVYSPARAPSPMPESRSGAPVVSDVRDILLALARETHADAVLLISKSGDSPAVLAYGGSINQDRAKQLAEMSMTMVQSTQSFVQFLEQSDAPFEHHIVEGNLLRWYILTLPGNLWLVMVVPLSTSLGIIRHSLRQAKRDLASLVLT
ncbi:MAG: response regulator [Anaerolineae bacterium]